MPIGFIRNIAGTIGRYSILFIVVCACCLTSCVHVDKNVKFTLFDYGDGPFKIVRLDGDSSVPAQAVALSGKKEVVVYDGSYCGVFEGLGPCLTESSAYALACLPEYQRHKILSECFGIDGAGFTVAKVIANVDSLPYLSGVSASGAVMDSILSQNQEVYSKEYYHYVNDEDYGLYRLFSDVRGIKISSSDSINITTEFSVASASVSDSDDDSDDEEDGSAVPSYLSSVQRYIAHIIWGMNNGVTRFTDVGLALDADECIDQGQRGCMSLAMVDVTTKEVEYTDLYRALRQFSLSLRPGDKILKVEMTDDMSEFLSISAAEKLDGMQYVLNILSSADTTRNVAVSIGGKIRSFNVEGNKLTTVKVMK